MSCAVSALLAGVILIPSLVLIILWSSSNDYNNAYTRGVCVTTGYLVNPNPTPCLRKCCAYDQNGYCQVKCNCWVGDILVNITAGGVFDAPVQTQMFSDISQADMVNILQSAYPLGQNFTCYYGRNNPDQIQFTLYDNVQALFIAAMVLFAVAGCLIITSVVLCIRDPF